jgi:hypothetical protein
MTEAAPRRQPLDWKALWRWSVPLGIIPGLLFAPCFYFGLENETLGLTNGLVEGLFIAYLLAFVFLSFLVGFLRGRNTGARDEGVRVMVSASALQALTTLVLIGWFSWAFHFWYMDRFGVLFALFGIDIESGGLGVAWWLGQALIWQIPLSVVAALIGGAIGSRARERRSRPDESTES